MMTESLYEPSWQQANPTRQQGVGVYERDPACIGYVVIPPDVERPAYVAQCYETQTICAVTDGGEFFRRIPVTKDTMALVEFPREKGQKGSPVLLLNLPRHNQPVVGGVFNSAEEVSQVLGEHRFSMLRRLAGRYVALTGDGEQGTMTLTVCGLEEGEGRLQLNVVNQRGAGQLDVNVRGDVTLRAEGALQASAGKVLSLGVNDQADSAAEMELRYERGQGLRYRDEWDNEILLDADKIQLRRKKDGRVVEISDQGISVGRAGSSAEPALLGDTLVKLIAELIRAILALQVQTNAGLSYPQTVFNRAAFESILNRLETAKSSVVTLD